MFGRLPARQVVCRITQVAPAGALDVHLLSPDGNHSHTRVAGPNATTTLALR